MNLNLLNKYITEKLFPEPENRPGEFKNFCGTIEQLDELWNIINPYIKDTYNEKPDVIRDERIIKILQREYPKEKVKGMVFYTLVPLDRLNISEENLSLANEYINNIDKTGIRDLWWVWESGKHKDKPNLHLHMLIDFVDKAPHNFARMLRIKWSKTFKGSSIEWSKPGGRGLDHKLCNTIQIQNDKLDYMKNELKGSHENFVDLQMRGHECP